MKKLIAAMILGVLFVVTTMMADIDRDYYKGWHSNSGQQSAPGLAYEVHESPDGSKYTFVCAGGSVCFTLDGPHLHIYEGPGVGTGSSFTVQQNP